MVQALKDGISYRDKVYDGMTDAQAVQTVRFLGGRRAKLTMLSFNTSHNNEHYGKMVTYLRMKGLVPPSSEGRR